MLPTWDARSSLDLTGYTASIGTEHTYYLFLRTLTHHRQLTGSPTQAMASVLDQALKVVLDQPFLPVASTSLIGFVLLLCVPGRVPWQRYGAVAAVIGLLASSWCWLVNRMVPEPYLVSVPRADSRAPMLTTASPPPRTKSFTSRKPRSTARAPTPNGTTRSPRPLACPHPVPLS